jgi:hypothetical protein
MTASLFGFALIRADDLRELKDQVSGLAARTAALDARARDLQAQADELELREQGLASLTDQLETRGRKLDAREREVARPDPAQASAPEPPAAAVREAIRLADGLFDLTGHGTDADELSPAAVLDWVGSRARDLLDTLAVKTIDDTGAFDPDRHHAVDVEPAPTPDLADQIAATVRPGYEWHGTLMQPQQVTIYTE